jgi:two-component system, repressor protein LuxO
MLLSTLGDTDIAMHCSIICNIRNRCKGFLPAAKRFVILALMAHSILLLEPALSQAQPILMALKRDGHALTAADTLPAARKLLLENPADLVLITLGATLGLDAVRELAAMESVGGVIVMTAQGSVQSAIEAMRAGAADVLILPVGTDKLRSAVSAALSTTGGPAIRRKAAGAAAAVVPSPESTETYYGFIGGTPQMRAVYRMIDSAAPSKATVFITGESGTGKEVCADAIHRRSPRAGGPFVPINCAAIPKDLMESEIFGHVKGAFTGATSDHAGAALQAHGGTLFLDEICEMDLSLQAKLLRFLQTGLVKKVGSEKVEAVDVRIVCATNRDPYAEVQAGRFREDLFYRLQVISIELPPLRERGDDVLLIARAFLDKFSGEERKGFKGFSPEAEAILSGYGWPGNVRQLMNVVRNVVVLNDGADVQPFMLPPPLNRPTMLIPPMLQDPRWAAMAGPMPFAFGMAPATSTPPPAANSASLPTSTAGSEPTPAHTDSLSPEQRIRPLWQVEDEAIEAAVRLCNGNITKAAVLLEINPCTIYRRRQTKVAEPRSGRRKRGEA